MLDDLVELIVDIGGDIVCSLVEHRFEKQKKKSTKTKKKTSKTLDPWEHPKEKPV